MGHRELKRVPLDFNFPIGEIWPGYQPHHVIDKIKEWEGYTGKSICDNCRDRGLECTESAEYCIYHPKNEAIWYYHPPTGPGYQMWETTSEGSPVTPVFKTLSELCDWIVENNITWFATMTATKEEWMRALDTRDAGTVIGIKKER